MKKFVTILSLLLSQSAHSQESKDTVFSAGAYNCPCKYHLNLSDDNKIFERNQVDATYPGGDKEWKKFLKKNLDNKMKGKDPVQLRFEVDKNGDPNDFLLMNNAPVGKFNEVIRVIRLSGKWFPAIQGGYCVKSYIRMMVEL